MLGILQRNGITDANCARNIATCPVKLFFLTPEFIRDNWDLAKLPAERLPETIAFAGMIQNSLRYRQLAWHLFQNFAKVSLNTHLQHKFPDIIDELGIDSGKLYLLLALSLIPYNRQRAELEGFPVRYADAAADRIGTTIRYFACKFDGAFGLLGSGLYFLMHFKETATYRIGRFDFVVFRNSSTPYIYGSGARTIAFCGNNWLLNRTGERVESQDDAVRISHFVSDGEKACGIPLDPLRGTAAEQETVIDLREWKLLSSPEDWTLFFHIPGGGGMTPQVCESSFREALDFFAGFMPEKTFSLIWSNSWIFNPDWLHYLPESNLSKLIRRGNLFTVPYRRTDGMFFVFGGDDKPLDLYPQNTSMERAMIRCMREKGTLRSSGWYLLPGEVRNNNIQAN